MNSYTKRCPDCGEDVSGLVERHEVQLKADERVATIDRICKFLATRGQKDAADLVFVERVRFYAPELFEKGKEK